MAKVFIEEQTLTDIADAVRGKNGTTEPIRTTELATAITNLPTGGGENKLPQMFNKTITELHPEDFGEATAVISNQFKDCNKLTYIELNDEMETLGGGAFYNTTASTIILNKNLKTIGSDCFRYSKTPTTVKFKGTLSDWFNLSVGTSGPLINSAESFYIDNELITGTAITIPEDITVIKDYAMRDAKITDFILHDGVTTIGTYAFYHINKSGTLDIPATITSVGGAALGGTQITKAIWRTSAQMRSQCFMSSNKLIALVITSETLVPLGSRDCFNITPIASGTGYIYVPSALLEDYKVATNWATYANQFRAIEDYPEILGDTE